jgi:hypothetical protein
VTIGTLEGKNLRLWTWIQAANALGEPISEETDTWFNYYSIESNQVAAKKLWSHLGRRIRMSLTSYWKLSISVPPETNSLSSNELEVPRGDLYKTLDNTLQDSRSIPITENGLVIRKRPQVLP